MQVNYLISSPNNWESYIFYKNIDFWQNTNMSDDIHKIFSEESLLNDLRISLKRFAFKLTKNEDDALDLLQQTFEKALINIDKFKGGSVKAWMSTMMKNKFIDNIRKKREELPGDDLQEVSVEGDQFSAIEESEANNKLDDCVKKLNEIEQDVIRLKISNYTVTEITEITGKSRVNVSQISVRAKIKLHTCMEVQL
jgi:RNA polymerase sigma-70 factor (ECF subfamily)|tara:strand:+ start:442 stop:1029 length:588 start_codon:yes stop_codon:yes gene_type:complete